MIPYGRQDISEQDIAEVVAVLKSDFLTQGPVVPSFEKSVADKVDAKFALAVNSATSALHIACVALGLKEKDILWTVPNTFVATANCALYCGAKVDFVDIDPCTWNICAEALSIKLRDAKNNGKLPKIIVPVHFSGEPCDMEKICTLARMYGVKVIEDASHAIGAHYQNGPIGNCAFSDITVFSFHPVKIVTTAEGGMVTTNDEKLYQKMNLLRSHGITRDAEYMSKKPEGPWYYEQIDLGWNYRMTELQAALGLSQMKRLDDFIEQRHQIARRYDELLAGLEISLPVRAVNSRSALHLYVIRISNAGNPEKARSAVFTGMRQAGIGVNVHYIPVHLQPWYRAMGFSDNMFPNSEAYYKEALSLPMFPNLTALQQDKVIDCLSGLLKE